jgi:diguanylate cyclase (GGDEF)-like protein
MENMHESDEARNHEATGDLLAGRHRELAVLHKTSLEINSQLDLTVLLKAIVERAAELVGVRMGGLYLVLPGEELLELVVSHNLPQDFTGTRLRFGEGVSGVIAQTGEYLMVPNYQTWSNRASIYSQTSFGRVLGVPLKSEGGVIGVINVTDDQKSGAFSQEEIMLVRMFADQAAIAIHNARLYERAQTQLEERRLAEDRLLKRNQELALLYRIISTASLTLQPEEVLKITLEELANELEFSQAGAALLDESGTRLLVVAEYPGNPSQSAIGNVIPIKGNLSTEYVLEKLKPLFVIDAQNDPWTAPIHELMVRRKVVSLLLLPLVVRGKIIGTIGLDSFERRQLSEEEIELAANAASAAAQAISNARLYREVQQLAITDTLTGLFNRRGLLELGGREIERARRFNRTLCVIMFDLDRFKDINDTYTHAVGDQVLNAVSQLCRKNLREVDILGRPGGDEFVILLPEATFHTATMVAERIRAAIAGTTFCVKKADIRVTASVGIAQSSKDTLDLAVLIDQADQAMYSAKQAGRNCISTYKEQQTGS